MKLYGGVESGGTKFICTVGTGTGEILAKDASQPPPSTKRWPEQGSFSKTRPKPGWSDVDIVGPFHSAFDVLIGFDTDINGAALETTATVVPVPSTAIASRVWLLARRSKSVGV